MPYSDKLNASIQSQYLADIAAHFHTLEQSHLIVPTLMDKQTDLSWNSRDNIVNHMILFHNSLNLEMKTVYTGIQIFDQYCSKRLVMRENTQLVGLTCLWIASKNHDEKGQVITLAELDNVTDHSYGAARFLKQEHHILSTISWRITMPTLHDCLEVSFASKNLQNHSNLFKLAEFLCELSFFDRSMLFFDNSLRTIAAILVAANILNHPSCFAWFKSDLSARARGDKYHNYTFPFLASYNESNVELRKLTALFLKLLLKPIPNGIQIKYNNAKDAPVLSKIQSFLKSLDEFLLYNKFNANVVKEYLVYDMDNLNHKKINFEDVSFRDYFKTLKRKANFPIKITNFVLGIDMVSPTTISIQSPKTPLPSPIAFATPSNIQIHSPSNCSTTSLVSSAISSTFSSPCGTSRSSSNASFDESMSETASPVSFEEIANSDFFDETISPKMLDYSKIYTTLNDVFIKERKRNLGEHVHSGKRQSPNVKDGYSYYFK